MKLIALLSLAWRVAAAPATSPEDSGRDAVYFANPIGEDFPVRHNPLGPSKAGEAGPSRKLAAVVKDRYIVKLCETYREPTETAAALAESVGAKVRHVYKHALSGFSVTDCSAEAAEALKNKPEVCSVLPSRRRRSHSMAEAGSGQEPYEAINFWGKNRVLDLPLDDRGDQSKGALGGKGVSIVVVDSGLDKKRAARRTATTTTTTTTTTRTATAPPRPARPVLSRRCSSPRSPSSRSKQHHHHLTLSRRIHHHPPSSFPV